MEKDVYITIKSTQCLEGEEQPGAELITRGEYHYEGDKVFFLYEEGEASGMGGTITRFDITPEEITLERRGEIRTKMIYRLGERTCFRYEMPYGLLNMDLDTHEIDADLNEHGGTLRIIYDLAMDERRTMVSRNRFDIEITDKIAV